MQMQMNGDALVNYNLIAGHATLTQNFPVTGNYASGENVYTEWYGLGTESSFTNSEGLRVGLLSGSPHTYVLETFANGTGVSNPLTIQTSGNTGQLVLNTDNSATFAGAVTVNSSTASTGTS